MDLEVAHFRILFTQSREIQALGAVGFCVMRIFQHSLPNVPRTQSDNCLDVIHGLVLVT